VDLSLKKWGYAMKRRLKIAAFFIVLLIGGGVCVVYIYNVYVGTLRRAKEVVLQQNLWTMRKAVDFHANDKGKRPKSFGELVSAGYLREIPVDPFTRSNQTWTIEREKESSAPNTPPGIIDVYSAAAGADKNGKLYNQY
jgi:general secretion pathway protein G